MSIWGVDGSTHTKMAKSVSAVQKRTTKPLELVPASIRMDPRLLGLLQEDAETLARENGDPRFGWSVLAQEICREYYRAIGQMDEAGNVIEIDQGGEED